MTRCPSDLELEAQVRDLGRATVHVRSCARCAERLEELRRLEGEFEREVFPATVEAVVARSARRPVPRWGIWLTPIATAAAVVVVLLARAGPRDSYLGVKGPLLSLVLFAQEPGGARALSDGEVVAPGAGLRFEVRAVRSCALFIVSADAEGKVSRIFPAAGADGIPIDPGALKVLPGGALLDGKPGPERFFAVCGCGDDPLRYDRVERAAGEIGPGEGHVRGAHRLSGLPADALQVTVLIEKRS
jgi:hypothetical protein